MVSGSQANMCLALAAHIFNKACYCYGRLNELRLMYNPPRLAQTDIVYWFVLNSDPTYSTGVECMVATAPKALHFAKGLR